MPCTQKSPIKPSKARDEFFRLAACPVFGGHLNGSLRPALVGMNVMAYLDDGSDSFEGKNREARHHDKLTAEEPRQEKQAPIIAALRLARAAER